MTHKSISLLGLQRIQALEGYHSEPVTLADGRCLYGHGHVGPNAPEKPLSRAEAMSLLSSDLAPIERSVNALVRSELSQSQFDALVSFTFSIGVGNFAKSEVLRYVNVGQFAAAGCAMDAWRKSTVSGQSEVVESLVRRRAQEKAMLLEAPMGASSAWLKPEIDHAATILAVPAQFAPACEPAPSVSSPVHADAFAVAKENPVLASVRAAFAKVRDLLGQFGMRRPAMAAAQS